MKHSCDTIKFCLVSLIGVLVFSSAIYSRSDAVQQRIQGYPIASRVFTTRQQTVVPGLPYPGLDTIFPYQLSEYSQYGYGTWSYGRGFDFAKRLDIMSASYRNPRSKSAASLLSFFTISDIHITDKESPAQAIYYGYRGLPGDLSSAYSGIMLYTTQVLDAAVQTVNALNKKNRIDFGISLGDAANNTQYNEIRWYIDVLDGQIINPDSGDKDDPVPGPYNDYQDEYKAAGLDRSIPWFQTIGNHDHFWMGTVTANDYIREHYTGTEILNMGDNIFTDIMSGLTARGFYMGSIDGRTPYGDIIGVGPVADFPDGPPQVLAADPGRRPLSKTEWMSEFFNTSSSPVGHGFTQSNLDNDFTCYSFEPKSNIPIKVIVMDDTNDAGLGQGALDQTRYDWLVDQLDSGQAEGKLMIIAAHIPIGVETPGGFLGWGLSSPVSEATLIPKLHTYPNLIMWIAGHRHCSMVTAFESPDSTRPELGFWEIETPSLRDFPQQFRTFDIVRNSDNTVSIFVTDIDPAVRPGSLAAISRSYGIATQQFFNNPILPAPNGISNAELVKQLSPEMQTKLARLKNLKKWQNN